MSRLKAGFAYFVFLFFVFLILSVVIGFSGMFLKYKQIQQLDLARLQAYYAAWSAVEYYKTGISLPDNTQANLDLEKLKVLPGFIYKFSNSGFKITENKNIIYFVGFSGAELDQARAVQVFERKNGKLNKWAGE